MLKSHAISSVLAALFAFLAFSQYNARKDAENAARERESMLSDSLVAVTETAKATMARATTSEQAVADLQEDLKDALEKGGQDVRTVVRTVIEARPETTTVTLRDTVVVGVRSWPFDWHRGRYFASGAVYPDSMTLDMTIWQSPIDLNVVITETKAGNFLTYVDSRDTTLTISEVNARFVPLRRSWWDRNRFKIGAGLGMIGAVIIGRSL